MSKTPHMGGISRRHFAVGAAAAATAALVQPGEALAQSAASKPAPLSPQAQAAMAKLSPASRVEVEMKVAEIFRKYGDKLSAEQKADIQKVMAETQGGLEKMRAFTVENGDQPADVLQLYRGEKS